MQPQFTLRQLSYFLTAVDHLSMTDAGRAAHVSQSAISLAVADLERQLGTQLFIRHHGHGLSLTDAGRRITPSARELIARATDLGDEAREIGESMTGTLRVACYETIAPFLIPRLVTGFTDRYPQVELAFAEGDMVDLHRLVRSGEAELMICYDLDLGSDIEIHSLAQTRPYVLMAPDHPLAGSSEVSLSELADTPFVLLDQPQSSLYFLGLFDAAGVTPAVRHRTSSFEMVRSLVARSLGYSLLIQRPVSDTSYEGLPLVCVPLQRPAHTLTIIAGVPRGIRQTRRGAAFVAHCSTELESAS